MRAVTSTTSPSAKVSHVITSPTLNPSVFSIRNSRTNRFAETPAFLNALRTYVEEITPQDKAVVAAEDEDKTFLREKLLVIKAACEEYDESCVESVLAELRKMTWSRQTEELLGRIAEQLLHSDFDEIAESIDKFDTISRSEG